MSRESRGPKDSRRLTGTTVELRQPVMPVNPADVDRRRAQLWAGFLAELVK